MMNVVNCFSVPAPRRLRFKVLSSSKLLVSWKEPKGDFDSYLFLYNFLPGRIILPYRHTHTQVEKIILRQRYLGPKFSGGRIQL